MTCILPTFESVIIGGYKTMHSQAQPSSLKPQLKLSFNFIPSFSPPHPGKSSKLNNRPVPVDSELGAQSSFQLQSQGAEKAATASG